jgi:hypothetical protein
MLPKGCWLLCDIWLFLCQEQNYWFQKCTSFRLSVRENFQFVLKSLNLLPKRTFYEYEDNSGL